MNVLISGASGLVGGALARSLTAGGHRVRRLVRRRPVAADAAFWDPAQFLHIDMDQFAAMVSVDTSDHASGWAVHPCQPVHAVTAQHPIDR